MQMRSLKKRNIKTNIISWDRAFVFMILVPGTSTLVLGDLSTCCCQHIDHVDNRPFLHQNYKRVAAPLRSNISLYERCNRKINKEASLKLHKKLRIYNVEEYSSIDSRNV